MKILYLQTFPLFGSGSGTYARELAEEVAKKHEVAMVAPEDRELTGVKIYKVNLPVKIAIGVGGAFDYISGKIPRAPFFVRKLGMEWLFRLLVQPWRIKRQLSLIEFAWLVIKEKLSRN